MAQSLVDKVKGILYRNGMGGTTLTGGKVEPVIINPPDRQKREGFENAKASNLVEKLLRKGRSSKGCSRCRSTCTCTKEERSQAQGSGLSEQDAIPRNVRPVIKKEDPGTTHQERDRAAKSGHLTPEQKDTRRRSKHGTTLGTPKVKTTSAPPNSDSVYEQRYVIPAQRPNLEQKVKVILGLDKDLKSKDINKQLPRRRGLKLTQAYEEINAGDAPMPAGKRKPAREGMESGTNVDSTNQIGNVYQTQTPVAGKPPLYNSKKKKTISASYETSADELSEVSYKLAYSAAAAAKKRAANVGPASADPAEREKQYDNFTKAKNQETKFAQYGAKKLAQQSSIPEEAGENDQPKGRLYLHLDVARRYALKFGGVVARDEGTGKYFVKAKGKYSIEQVEGETLGKKVLTILESIRFRTAQPVPFIRGKRKPIKYARPPTKPRTLKPTATRTEEVGFGSSPVPAFMQKR